MRRSTSPAWWSDLVKTGIVCAALAATVFAVGVRAAETTASNIDLMQNMTSEVIRELHGKFAPSLNGRAVQLKPASNTEDYTFVSNVFREELTKLGVKVIDTNAAVDVNTPDAPLILQYQNVVFNLKYTDSHRSFVIGGKRVERSAAVRIMSTLTDPGDGHVVWVGEASRNTDDEIDYGKAEQIEQGTYTFNKPVVPSAGWGKFVEPVFVTGIIVGLIYLFFSNQSDN